MQVQNTKKVEQQSFETDLVEKSWYKQFWPWFLIILPSAVIVACLYTVFLTVDNPLSLVKQDYYKEGLEINQNKALYKEADRLGIQVQLQVLDDQTFQARLLSNKDAVAILSDLSSLSVQFYHPVDSRRDVQLLFTKKDFPVYGSAKITTQQWDLLLQEKRWYIYLQSEKKDWALYSEASLQESLLKNKGLITLGSQGE